MTRLQRFAIVAIREHLVCQARRLVEPPATDFCMVCGRRAPSVRAVAPKPAFAFAAQPARDQRGVTVLGIDDPFPEGVVLQVASAFPPTA